MLAEGKKFYFGVEGWAEGGDREWFEEEEWKSIDYFEASTKGTEYLNALFWFPEFPRISAVKISSPVVSSFVSHVLFLSPNTHSNENLKSLIFFFSSAIGKSCILKQGKPSALVTGLFS